MPDASPQPSAAPNALQVLMLHFRTKSVVAEAADNLMSGRPDLERFVASLTRYRIVCNESDAIVGLDRFMVAVGDLLKQRQQKIDALALFTVRARVVKALQAT